MTSQPLVECRRRPIRPSFPQCTFPDDCHPPSSLQESLPSSAIAFNIGSEFRLPELRSGRGGGRVEASFVTMPEASMHEADGSESAKDQVRRPGKHSVMKTVPEAMRMQRAPKYQLGFRILPTNPRHHSRPDGPIDRVDHELACTASGEPFASTSRKATVTIHEDGDIVRCTARDEFAPRKTSGKVPNILFRYHSRCCPRFTACLTSFAPPN